MYKSSLLNTSTKWNNLPWQHIVRKIQFIQKKIYVFSKQCCISKVREYQNLLLNCNEAKIYAIEYICKHISQYYYIGATNYYTIDEVHKFYLFQYLFNEEINYEVTNINSKLNILFQKIVQYLVYLSIEPEWQAKIQKKITLLNKV